MPEYLEKLTRGKFLRSVGALAAALPLGAAAFDFGASPGRGFNFMLLGDIHFDKPDHHDMDYVSAKYPNDIRQIENYSRITRDNFPLLMNAVRERSKQIDADFFLQLGDFVEGLCGSEALARKQTDDFIAYVKSLQLRRPFFVVKGNHDITGEGATKVYDTTVLSWQEREQRHAMPSANSTFVHKDVRFVIFDCYRAEESLEWLKGVLATHKESLLVFSVHQPIVPYNARANWHVFAKPRDSARRAELLDLLGRNRAIVLTGHLHKTSVLTRTTPSGKFVQVGIGSVIDSPQASVKHHVHGVEAYTDELLNLEPQFSPATYDERKVNIENERPFIRHFAYADLCGYGNVNVSASREVELVIFANADVKPWATFNLTRMLDEI